MAELDFEVTDEVDITDKVCPLTFVKAKVAIEELEDGDSGCPHERWRTSAECSAQHERRRA